MDSNGGLLAGAQSRNTSIIIIIVVVVVIVIVIIIIVVIIIIIIIGLNCKWVSTRWQLCSTTVQVTQSHKITRTLNIKYTGQ
jgi:hypothetical protein